MGLLDRLFQNPKPGDRVAYEALDGFSLYEAEIILARMDGRFDLLVSVPGRRTRELIERVSPYRIKERASV